jgi:hypothetical protein
MVFLTKMFCNRIFHSLGSYFWKNFHFHWNVKHGCGIQLRTIKIIFQIIWGWYIYISNMTSFKRFESKPVQYIKVNPDKDHKDNISKYLRMIYIYILLFDNITVIWFVQCPSRMLVT